MTDGLEGVRVKFRRAERHIQEVMTAIEAFRATEPYEIDTRRDPETRRLIYYLSKASDVPANVSVIASEVLQSLRSALDHIAYQLVVAGTGQHGPFTHVYFPIFDSETAYNAQKARYVRGMRQDAIDAIDALRPYKDGNDALWKLHKLNIIDKHRLLVTVGAQVEASIWGVHTGQMQFPDGTVCLAGGPL